MLLAPTGFFALAGGMFSYGFRSFVMVGDFFADVHGRRSFADFDVWSPVACHLFHLSFIAACGVPDCSLDASGNGTPERGGVAVLGGVL